MLILTDSDGPGERTEAAEAENEAAMQRYTNTDSRRRTRSFILDLASRYYYPQCLGVSLLIHQNIKQSSASAHLALQATGLNR